MNHVKKLHSAGESMLHKGRADIAQRSLFGLRLCDSCLESFPASPSLPRVGPGLIYVYGSCAALSVRINPLPPRASQPALTMRRFGIATFDSPRIRSLFI
ncbi:hypothetical protein AAHC03_018957 [Spirometra sp. Aus1]